MNFFIEWWQDWSMFVRDNRGITEDEGDPNSYHLLKLDKEVL